MHSTFQYILEQPDGRLSHWLQFYDRCNQRHDVESECNSAVIFHGKKSVWSRWIETREGFRIIGFVRRDWIRVREHASVKQITTEMHSPDVLDDLKRYSKLADKLRVLRNRDITLLDKQQNFFECHTKGIKFSSTSMRNAECARNENGELKFARAQIIKSYTTYRTNHTNVCECTTHMLSTLIPKVVSIFGSNARTETQDAHSDTNVPIHDTHRRPYMLYVPTSVHILLNHVVANTWFVCNTDNRFQNIEYTTINRPETLVSMVYMQVWWERRRPTDLFNER